MVPAGIGRSSHRRACAATFAGQALSRTLRAGRLGHVLVALPQMTAVRFRSINKSIRHNSLFGLLVVRLASAAVAPWALAKSPTASCTSYKGGAAEVVETFTHIKASGVSCKRSHEVLGTFANSAPGDTDLGFRYHGHREGEGLSPSSRRAAARAQPRPLAVAAQGSSSVRAVSYTQTGYVAMRDADGRTSFLSWSWGPGSFRAAGRPPSTGARAARRTRGLVAR